MSQKRVFSVRARWSGVWFGIVYGWTDREDEGG